MTLRTIGLISQYICIGLAIFIILCIRYHKKHPDVSWKEFSSPVDLGWGESSTSKLTDFLFISIIWPLSGTIYFIYRLVKLIIRFIKLISKAVFDMPAYTDPQELTSVIPECPHTKSDLRTIFTFNKKTRCSKYKHCYLLALVQVSNKKYKIPQNALVLCKLSRFNTSDLDCHTWINGTHIEDTIALEDLLINPELLEH